MEKNDVGRATKTWKKEIDLQKAEKGKLKANAFKFKERICRLWNNTLNSRYQAFWQYYWSKQIPDVYKKPLEKSPPPDAQEVPPKHKKKRKSEHYLV